MYNIHARIDLYQYYIPITRNYGMIINKYQRQRYIPISPDVVSER